MKFHFRMTAVSYSLIGVIVYFVYLLATIPADFTVNKLLPENLPSSTKMINPSGTLWSGRLAHLSVRQIDLGSVRWELSALPLLWGTANFYLDARRDDAYLSSQVSFSTRRLELADSELDFPLRELMPLLYGFPLSFDGKLKAHFKQVIITPAKQFSINGRALIADVKLTAPQAISLGDFSIEFEAVENGTRITINDNQGPVAVNAVVNVDGTGKYAVKSTFTPQSVADQAIKNSLALLGKADSQGRYSFSYKGVLPLSF